MTGLAHVRGRSPVVFSMAHTNMSTGPLPKHPHSEFPSGVKGKF